MNIFIIPGNPPASYYYLKWIEELKESSLFSGFHFHIYPEFKNEKNSVRYLEKMISFYEGKLANLENVVLLGHSVGGKIAYEIMKKNPSNVKKCYLLFPFLCRPGLRGRMVLSLVPQLTDLLGFEVIFKSKNYIKYIVKEVEVLTREEVSVCLGIVSHERNTVAKTLTIERVDPVCGEKIKVFYTDGDTWCGKNSTKQFSKFLNSKKLNLSHEFVVKNSERALLTQELIMDLETL
ncbi:MAG: hypothetical protein R3A80_11930 [Bdellovibrionota bacterium]